MQGACYNVKRVIFLPQKHQNVSGDRAVSEPATGAYSAPQI